MAASDDSAHRRPVFFPVVIAGVFLAIIGASVGLVFGSLAAERRAADERAAQKHPGQPVVVTTSTDAAPPSRQPTPAATPSSLRPRASASPTVARLPCREETERQAAAAGSVGALSRVLYLRTTESDVWICVDGEGRLFYHGHRGGPDDPWVEGQNALFLTDVQRLGDGYQARATGRQGTVTTFLVNRRELVIQRPDGQVEREPAVEQ